MYIHICAHMMYTYCIHNACTMYAYDVYVYIWCINTYTYVRIYIYIYIYIWSCILDSWLIHLQCCTVYLYIYIHCKYATNWRYHQSSSNPVLQEFYSPNKVWSITIPGEAGVLLCISHRLLGNPQSVVDSKHLHQALSKFLRSLNIIYTPSGYD